MPPTSVDPDLSLPCAALDTLEIAALGAASDAERATQPPVRLRHELQVLVVVGQTVVRLPRERVAAAAGDQQRAVLVSGRGVLGGDRFLEAGAEDGSVTDEDR